MADPWMQERRVDRLSLLVGVLAVVGAVLVLLDRAGWVRVDELVVLASFWIALGGAGLVRSALRLRQRLRHGRDGERVEQVRGA